MTTRNNNKNYHKTLTDMYGLMVAFDPTRSTVVSGGRNKGMNFRNVAAQIRNQGETGIMTAAALHLERLSVGAVGRTI